MLPGEPSRRRLPAFHVEGTDCEMTGRGCPALHANGNVGTDGAEPLDELMNDAPLEIVLTGATATSR